MPHEITLPNGHLVSDDRARLDMPFVLDSLETTAWGAGRPRGVITRSWANCLPFGIYAPAGGMAGFARLLTDYALRAHLGDVYIRPASRGLGLGKALVETILAHPALATVTRWTLSTTDAHGLYARYGFQTFQSDGRWMTLDRRE